MVLLQNTSYGSFYILQGTQGRHLMTNVTSSREYIFPICISFNRNMEEGPIHISLDIRYPVHIPLMFVDLKQNNFRNKDIIYLPKHLHLLDSIRKLNQMLFQNIKVSCIRDTCFFKLHVARGITNSEITLHVL